MDRPFLPITGEIAEPPRGLAQVVQPVIRRRWAVVVDSWVEVALLEEAS